jgi:hypothetical protein
MMTRVSAVRGLNRVIGAAYHSNSFGASQLPLGDHLRANYHGHSLEGRHTGWQPFAVEVTRSAGLSIAVEVCLRRRSAVAASHVLDLRSMEPFRFLR